MSWGTVQTLVAEQAVKAGAVSAWSGSISNAGEIALELEVTAAPRMTTPVRVTVQRSLDGTNWSESEPARQFVNVNRVGRYVMTLPVDAPYVRYAWMPLNYGLTATLRGVTR